MRVSGWLAALLLGCLAVSCERGENTSSPFPVLLGEAATVMKEPSWFDVNSGLGIVKVLVQKTGVTHRALATRPFPYAKGDTVRVWEVWYDRDDGGLHKTPVLVVLQK